MIGKKHHRRKRIPSERERELQPLVQRARTGVEREIFPSLAKAAPPVIVAGGLRARLLQQVERERIERQKKIQEALRRERVLQQRRRKLQEDDRRRFSFYKLRDWGKHGIVVDRTRHTRLPWKLAFKYPHLLAECLRRRARREVLHA